jgi:type IV secretory pathway VirB2 component (pilin)
VNKKNIALFLTVALTLFNSEVFAAAAAGNALPMDGFLIKLANSVSGVWAYSFAIIGIVSTGIMLIFRGEEIGGFFRAFLQLVLVISIIVLAKAILTSVTGIGAEIPLTAPVNNLVNWFQSI